MPARTPEPQTCRHRSGGMGAVLSGKTATPLQTQQMLGLAEGWTACPTAGFAAQHGLQEDSSQGPEMSTARPSTRHCSCPQPGDLRAPQLHQESSSSGLLAAQKGHCLRLVAQQRQLPALLHLQRTPSVSCPSTNSALLRLWCTAFDKKDSGRQHELCVGGTQLLHCTYTRCSQRSLAGPGPGQLQLCCVRHLRPR